MRQQKKPRTDICALTSEDNNFEWNPVIHCSDEMSKTLLCHHNKKFKNNEPVVEPTLEDDLTNQYFLDIDICNEFLNISPGSDLLTRRYSPNTPLESVLPNIVSPKDTSPKRLLNDLFSDDKIAITVSLTDDHCMHSLHTHESYKESSVDTHECNGIQEKDELEEIMHEIPVQKTGKPRNKSLMPTSICMIDTIDPLS